MKVLLVGLAFAAAVVGGGIGYASLKTGTNPVEYLSKDGLSEVVSGRGNTEGTSEQRDTENNPSAGRNDASEHVQPSRPVMAGPNDIVISEDDLNQMVTDAIASSGAPVLDIAKDVNTELKNDKIESGITINLGDVPLEELPTETQASIEQLIQTFPFLADRDMYIGIEGNPKVIDGDVRLNNANVRLGALTLPADSVASTLGVSQSDIEQQLNDSLKQQGLTPEDIQVRDGQIIIVGIPQ